APGLAAGPAAVVPVALAGAAALGGAVRVYIKGVVGAAVRPERIGQAGGGVSRGDVAVDLLAGDAGSPVQQGDVQHTVDDKAVVVRIVHGTPGLQEPAAGLVAGQQLVGGGDGGVPGLFAAHQLPGGHAGGAVEEAHVMVVHHHLAGDAVGKAVDVHQGGLFERLAAGGLVGQPDLAGPEAAGPLFVGAAGIDAVHAGVVLALPGVQGQIGLYLRAGVGQGLTGFGVGEGAVGEGFHVGQASLQKKGGAGFNPGPARHCDGDILPGFAAGGGIGSLQGYFNP